MMEEVEPETPPNKTLFCRIQQPQSSEHNSNTSNLNSTTNNSNTNNRSNNMLVTLLSKMQPRNLSCFADTTFTENTTDHLQFQIPSMLENIRKGITVDDKGKEKDKDKDKDNVHVESKRVRNKRKEIQGGALSKLYKLTDLDHKSNRVPILCTDRWNVTETLATCISNKATCKENRRMACLVLNNLSIPFENKAFLVKRNDLLSALMVVIRNMSAESYLCCICLFNLSFLEDAKGALLHYCCNSHSHANNTVSALEEPSSFTNNGTGTSTGTGTGTDAHSPLESPLSLVRTTEQMVSTYTGILIDDTNSSSTTTTTNNNSILNKGKRTKVRSSVEGEAVRWTIGLVRNLTSTKEGCLILGQTQLPKLMTTIISGSNPDVRFWGRDSLEDFCVQSLVHLAQHAPSLVVLRNIGAKDSLAHLVGQGGIHDLRAATIIARIEEFEQVQSTAASAAALEQEREEERYTTIKF